jgi:hypothetical protein
MTDRVGVRGLRDLPDPLVADDDVGQVSDGTEGGAVDVGRRI